MLNYSSQIMVILMNLYVLMNPFCFSLLSIVGWG